MEETNTKKLSYLMIGNGMAVLFIGLLAGFMLIFALLDAVHIWPLPAIDVSIPGSVRGWSAAHVGGILNGVMIGVAAMLMSYLTLDGRRAFWVGWGMIITGWANTVFYWAGSLSQNRGLSMGDTPYGATDIWGMLAFLGGAGGMFFTLVAVAILGIAAFKKAADT